MLLSIFFRYFLILSFPGETISPSSESSPSETNTKLANSDGGDAQRPLKSDSTSQTVSISSISDWVSPLVTSSIASNTQPLTNSAATQTSLATSSGDQQGLSPAQPTASSSPSAPSLSIPVAALHPFQDQQKAVYTRDTRKVKKTKIHKSKAHTSHSSSPVKTIWERLTSFTDDRVCSVRVPCLDDVMRRDEASFLLRPHLDSSAIYRLNDDVFEGILKNNLHLFLLDGDGHSGESTSEADALSIPQPIEAFQMDGESDDNRDGEEDAGEGQRRRKRQRDFDETLHQILLQPNHLMDMLNNYIYSPFIQTVLLPPLPVWCGNSSAFPSSLQYLRREDFSPNAYLIRVKDLPDRHLPH